MRNYVQTYYNEMDIQNIFKHIYGCMKLYYLWYEKLITPQLSYWINMFRHLSSFKLSEIHLLNSERLVKLWPFHKESLQRNIFICQLVKYKSWWSYCAYKVHSVNFINYGQTLDITDIYMDFIQKSNKWVNIVPYKMILNITYILKLLYIVWELQNIT